MPLSLKIVEVQIKGDQWNKWFRKVQVHWKFYVDVDEPSSETQGQWVSPVEDVDEQAPTQPLTWRSESATQAKILNELNVCFILTNCVNFVCFRYHTYSYREDLRFNKRTGICPRGGRRCSLWCFFRSFRSTNNGRVRLHWHILQNKGTWNHSNYIKEKFSLLFQKV